MSLARTLLPLMRQTGYAYPNLEKELDQLSEAAQRDLLRLIQNQASETQKAKRDARMGLGRW